MKVIEVEFQTVADRNWFIKAYKMKYYSLGTKNGKYYLRFCSYT